MTRTLGNIESQVGQFEGNVETSVSRVEEIPARTARICVVGLGYVGLPLAVAFDREGHVVTGYDVDREKVERLRAGEDTTGDLCDETVAASEVQFTTDPAAVADAEYVLVSVPTPVDSDSHPDLHYVESAGRTVGEAMQPGTTVVLESTVYPGATREVLVPALEEGSGLTCGEEFSVAYSPERATPGDAEHGLRDVVKVVGADDPRVRDDVADLYETVVDAGVHRAPSLAVAEAAKVVENVQRDVNIALVNELAMAFEWLDVDVQAVLEAAGTKWNFHDYRPGLVGGHCIPVDPYYLVHSARRAGYEPRLVQAGRDVNEAMPGHVADVTVKALNAAGKAPSRCRVLILGFAYKPDVADVRSSKAAEVVAGLREFDVSVVGADPHVGPDALRGLGVEPHPVLPAVTDGGIESAGGIGAEGGIEAEGGIYSGGQVGTAATIDDASSFDDTKVDDTATGFDGIVLATAHREYLDLDYGTLMDGVTEPVVVDVPGALDSSAFEGGPVRYRGV